MGAKTIQVIETDLTVRDRYGETRRVLQYWSTDGQLLAEGLEECEVQKKAIEASLNIMRGDCKEAQEKYKALIEERQKIAQELRDLRSTFSQLETDILWLIRVSQDPLRAKYVRAASKNLTCETFKQSCEVPNLMRQMVMETSKREQLGECVRFHKKLANCKKKSK
jgi:predicted nuclease with TOPRIM domain